MKLRLISAIIFTTAVGFLDAMASIPFQKTEVTTRVLNENGEPIEGAEVWIWYSNPRSDGQGGVIDGVRKSGFTNEEGIVVTLEDGRAGISTRVKKDGYYSHGHYPAKKDYFGSSRMPKELKKEITLRRIMNPISLYAKRTSAIAIPVEDEWIGYDLEFGDWVRPHGNGKRSDMLLRYTKRFLGIKEAYLEDLDRARSEIKRKYERRGEVFSEDALRHEIGKWEGTLEISFPEEKEGIISIVEAFMPNSLLKMPHLAVGEGYGPSYSMESSNFATSEKTHFSKVNEEKGFFVRTRVVLDRQGNIESANYAKIYGDIAFDPRGVVSFSYYFNPVVNDRNLEFDPEQNLFPEGAPGTFNFVLP